ncbi:hypothetical protein THOM_1978 [Trachipleistophora hominis]|uniref:Uncharacterized protein n=1 Tax=Trachipleistophora hominis TaxID=72359 RepID=L7JWF8_TRAHO|nr:hypothetical protein THOM_1978 [Trachipleistophora hominis]
MRIPLSEKNTRSKQSQMHKQHKQLTDKQRVLNFLCDVTNTTNDHSLKYDLMKCVETIEGKENVEYVELKGALREALEENERLEQDKVKLMCENEYLKEMMDKKKDPATR